jgi:hypothetical protein
LLEIELESVLLEKRFARLNERKPKMVHFVDDLTERCQLENESTKKRKVIPGLRFNRQFVTDLKKAPEMLKKSSSFAKSILKSSTILDFQYNPFLKTFSSKYFISKKGRFLFKQLE